MAKNLENKVGNNKVYTFDDAVRKSTEYFKGDEMAAKNFVNKYALKDIKGNIYESNPDQMHQRLAKEIERIENKYENPMGFEKIYGLLKDFKHIVPQGGPMAGIGNNYQVASLSNCFVVGNGADSYGGIMKTDEEQVQLMKRRGGVGHDMSHLRPSNSPVQNSAKSSSGIVSFMERYSHSTREVAQDGRRGALMLTLSSKHPDVEGFVGAKVDTSKITGANVSVKIDDEFMEAVKYNRNNPSKEKKMYTQQFPVDSKNPSHTKKVNPNELWDKIVHNAWKSAEPGVLFWDKVKRESVADSYADLGYETVSTNPCGEIPLCPNDSCRLLAMNLYGYVDKPFTKEAKFDFDKFKEYAQYAQRIMDDIIDLEIEKVDGIMKKIENDPEGWEVKKREYNVWKDIKHKAEEGRRTGVGITGEGDMLAALGLTYGTDKGNDFSERVHKNLALEAYRSSVQMAKERGQFEIYDSEREKDNPFINRIKKEDPELYKEMTENGRRNISLLTVAPTGTTSLMTQTSSGLEPVFNVKYKRRRKVNPSDQNVNVSHEDKNGDAWEEYNVFHHKFEDWLNAQGYDVEEVKKKEDKDLNEIVKKSPYYKATANDVDWKKKVELQGKVQKWVDHSISVTINLPEEVDEKLVGDLYQKAWEEGCKGVTVYREGSRSGVLVNDKKKKGNLEEKVFPQKRPKEMNADVLKFKVFNKDKTPEDWIAFVGKYENRPYEIFTGKQEEEVLSVPKSINEGKIVKEKNGENSHYDFVFKDRNGFESKVGGISHQFKKEYWNYAKFVSGMLRNEVEIPEVIDIVSKLDEGVEGINTWKAGVERALKKYIPDGTDAKASCPDCGGKMIYKESCMTCPSCGHSACG